MDGWHRAAFQLCCVTLETSCFTSLGLCFLVLCTRESCGIGGNLCNVPGREYTFNKIVASIVIPMVKMGKKFRALGRELVGST